MLPEVRERTACMAAASGRGWERTLEQERVLQSSEGRELRRQLEDALGLPGPGQVAEAPWSVAEWAVALRFDHPRATVPVLLLG